MKDFLNLKNVLRLCENWIVASTLIKNKEFYEITRLSKEALQKLV